MPHVCSHPSWEYPQQPGPEVKRGHHPGQRELLQGRLARSVQCYPEGEHERDERGRLSRAHSSRRRETKLVRCACHRRREAKHAVPPAPPLAVVTPASVLSRLRRSVLYSPPPFSSHQQWQQPTIHRRMWCRTEFCYALAAAVSALEPTLFRDGEESLAWLSTCCGFCASLTRLAIFHLLSGLSGAATEGPFMVAFSLKFCTENAELLDLPVPRQGGGACSEKRCFRTRRRRLGRSRSAAGIPKRKRKPRVGSGPKPDPHNQLVSRLKYKWILVLLRKAEKFVLSGTRVLRTKCGHGQQVAPIQGGGEVSRGQNRSKDEKTAELRDSRSQWRASALRSAAGAVMTK